MIYLDTSAIVKLLVQEEHSKEVHKAVELKPVRTVSIAFVEVLSALSRKSDLDDDERVAAVREFQASWHRFNPVPTDSILEVAGVLTRSYQLRAFDAIHLAAAKELGPPSTILFAVYDLDLARAAHREGFKLLTDPKFKLAIS